MQKKTENVFWLSKYPTLQIVMITESNGVLSILSELSSEITVFANSLQNMAKNN